MIDDDFLDDNYLDDDYDFEETKKVNVQPQVIKPVQQEDPKPVTKAVSDKESGIEDDAELNYGDDFEEEELNYGQADDNEPFEKSGPLDKNIKINNNKSEFT